MSVTASITTTIVDTTTTTATIEGGCGSKQKDSVIVTGQGVFRPLADLCPVRCIQPLAIDFLRDRDVARA